MKNKEISLLMSHGRAYNSGSFLLKSFNISHISDIPVKNEIIKLKTNKRIAYLASKKVFNTAVSRNKAKRRLKNALYKAILNNTPKNKGLKSLLEDKILIVSAKKGVLTVDFKELTQEFRSIVGKML